MTVNEEQAQKIELVREITLAYYQHDKDIEYHRREKKTADRIIEALEVSKKLILDQLSGLGLGWIPTPEDAKSGKINRYWFTALTQPMTILTITGR